MLPSNYSLVLALVLFGTLLTLVKGRSKPSLVNGPYRPPLTTANPNANFISVGGDAIWDEALNLYLDSAPHVLYSVNNAFRRVSKSDNVIDR
ncbi:hypothetical protein RvY_04415 [Ramazzottius varieornatus]|uniref:Uncharacterized protein n=1 Tax=Ramazzottius varieornatus TaxID=947166 RepID=A0A1D1URI4_RAMVA|nr:hypothetical protein RvY_04415 [Ramazzottius varieornatus]